MSTEQIIQQHLSLENLNHDLHPHLSNRNYMKALGKQVTSFSSRHLYTTFQEGRHLSNLNHVYACICMCSESNLKYTSNFKSKRTFNKATLP